MHGMLLPSHRSGTDLSTYICMFLNCVLGSQTASLPVDKPSLLTTGPPHTHPSHKTIAREKKREELLIGWNSVEGRSFFGKAKCPPQRRGGGGEQWL